MDVTGVLGVKLDPGQLQLMPEMNLAPSRAEMPQAVKPAEPSDRSHQAGYQRQQGSSKDTVELRKRNQEWEKPKMVPSLPEFEFHVLGSPKAEESPAKPNSRAIEVMRRYDQLAHDPADQQAASEPSIDVAA